MCLAVLASVPDFGDLLNCADIQQINPGITPSSKRRLENMSNNPSHTLVFFALRSPRKSGNNHDIALVLARITEVPFKIRSIIFRTPGNSAHTDIQHICPDIASVSKQYRENLSNNASITLVFLQRDGNLSNNSLVVLTFYFHTSFKKWVDNSGIFQFFRIGVKTGSILVVIKIMKCVETGRSYHNITLISMQTLLFAPGPRRGNSAPMLPANGGTKISRCGEAVGEDAIDRRAGNAGFLGNLGGAEPFSFELTYQIGVDARLTPLVDTFGFCLGNAFELAFAPQVGLELGEHPEHVEKAFPGGGSGINRLLGAGQGGALVADRANDGLQVTDGAGEPVDPGDHQRIARPQEFQHGCQFGPTGRAGAAGLLFPDDLAAGSAQRGNLNRGVLVGGGNPRVADSVRHFCLRLSRLSLRPSPYGVSDIESQPKKDRRNRGFPRRVLSRKNVSLRYTPKGHKHDVRMSATGNSKV